MTTNTQQAPAGWYVLSPDGGCWVAVRIGSRGTMVAMIEAANAETHVRAGGLDAAIVEAIQDGNVNENVNAQDAAAIVAAWDEDAFGVYVFVVVEEIILD